MHTIQLTILDFMPDEEKCLEDLRATRWPEGVICPICDCRKTKKNGTENGKQRYYCYGHGGTFRDTTNTIFYYSKLALCYWYYFIFHYLQNDSANHLKEVLKISYKTALRMVRKIQSVLNGKSNEIKLKGNVEFDELYLSCGAKGETDLEREPRKRGLKLRGRGTMDEDKPPIIGACDRKGNLRLKVSEHADSNSICAFFLCIMATISDLFKVFTDDFTSYRFLDKTWIPHETVNHSAKEYARGEVHNNTIEGYWSVFRHWMNTYRGVSKKHLAEYVSFFEFVENNKKPGWIPMLHKIIFLLRLKLRLIHAYALHVLLKNTKSQLINSNQMLIATVSFT